jgi:hypothetical protein
MHTEQTSEQKGKRWGMSLCNLCSSLFAIFSLSFLIVPIIFIIIIESHFIAINKENYINTSHYCSLNTDEIQSSNSSIIMNNTELQNILIETKESYYYVRVFAILAFIFHFILLSLIIARPLYTQEESFASSYHKNICTIIINIILTGSIIVMFVMNNNYGKYLEIKNCGSICHVQYLHMYAGIDKQWDVPFMACYNNKNFYTWMIVFSVFSLLEMSLNLLYIIFVNDNKNKNRTDNNNENDNRPEYGTDNKNI